MREIKFRCYNKKTKDWIWDKTPFYLIGETTMFDLLGQFSIQDYNDLELVQYTGLKDSKGVEIYEGDILATDTEIKHNFPTRFIKWDDDRVGFCFYGSLNSTTEMSGHALCKGNMNIFDIIGNIYENPNLLKGGE